MTPVEATAAMSYANQLDARVPVNEANADLWASALAGVSAEWVKWIIKDHYTRHTDSRGEATTITPAVIRKRAHVEAERAAAKRAALERTPDRPVTVESWRRRNPAAWDAEVQRGAVQRLEELERRGRLDDDDAARLAQYRATGTLPSRHERQNDPWSA